MNTLNKYLPVILVCLVAIYVTFKQQPQIVTASCPVLESSVVKNMVTIEGQECEEIGTYNELLQPSGLWYNRSYSCWKLEVPIKEYCKTNYCSEHH